jgi:hypothetical protein
VRSVRSGGAFLACFWQTSKLHFLRNQEWSKQCEHVYYECANLQCAQKLPICNARDVEHANRIPLAILKAIPVRTSFDENASYTCTTPRIANKILCPLHSESAFRAVRFVCRVRKPLSTLYLFVCVLVVANPWKVTQQWRVPHCTPCHGPCFSPYLISVFFSYLYSIKRTAALQGLPWSHRKAPRHLNILWIRYTHKHTYSHS